MIYSPETVYFIAYAKLSHNIPAGKMLETVGVGLIINRHTGVIEDTSCTLLTDEAKQFLKEIIVGFNLHNQPIDMLLDKIADRYHGFSQKAVCVAVNNAYERYIQWNNN
ncbi:DUF3870 domain-containing protein [Acidaminobacter sp. JC074]|uniref:DUF3870 domain-containing protein n=1 Tax=Acidaminobacter sp. JC074 TaxID=2530199 RepID=UPI001F0FDAC1|nr:DUF3870 domain-containing protein [Acidaminobacter sp. JC074]MCH4891259.1 DUF3870 domain-containing protein [Acidaminobacter sp. JC074]